METPDQLNPLLRVIKLTWPRIVFALAVAIIADGLQFVFVLVPLVDQAIDVAAFALTAWAVGFHLLLLPTFIVELIPVADMLPTWTACVIAVIALRKRAQNAAPPPPPPQLKDGRE